MFYQKAIQPILFNKDAEEAHDLALNLASKTQRSPTLAKLVNIIYGLPTPELQTEHFGLTFPNPVGLAAGFDKNGTTPLAMQALGFGFVEVGSITARASVGNPKPRAFRLSMDDSLINRMGLNNDGADAVIDRLKDLNLDIPLGVNIAKTNDHSIQGDDAIQDYVYSYKKASTVADYITVNISCPNTGEGKTFEDPVALDELLSALFSDDNDENKKPTLVKFTVDIERELLAKLVSICEAYGISGYIATNTSSSRKGLKTPGRIISKIGTGGLSGKAIQERSTEVVRWLHEITEGQKPIVGVGGIDDADAAIKKLEAGASLIQIYTGMIYKGPGLVRNLKKGLRNYKTNS
ncbi:MAG: quinone-dependent dihydroorotate dehydrogenase [Gracilimonas sp.]|nr:quinone-dependent dihydroorotate dehydrogenase [Gracilimonas sp.]